MVPRAALQGRSGADGYTMFPSRGYPASRPMIVRPEHRSRFFTRRHSSAAAGAAGSAVSLRVA
jgi:hypothetical protein